jgi:hypothetical protein
VCEEELVDVEGELGLAAVGFGFTAEVFAGGAVDKDYSCAVVMVVGWGGWPGKGRGGEGPRTVRDASAEVVVVKSG